MTPLAHLTRAALIAAGLTPALAWAKPAAAPTAEPLTRIAFGSCNKQNFKQPMWRVIADWDPELFIWLGDNIYGDTTDPDTLASKWKLQKDNPAYRKFADSVDIIGTWDDHDFGKNDGGRDFPIKAEAQRLILDFLDEPLDSPRRKQAGIYTSEVYGPPGRQVCVVLLDVRYFRDQPGTEDADILGKTQWTWLERTLQRSQAQVHLICSGSQIIPSEHRYEKWADYPGARERLLKLIARSRASGVVLLSGDRHFGEMSLEKIGKSQRPLIEITTSGLTHAWEEFPGEPNKFRLGNAYAGLNFGTIAIDWPQNSLQIHLRNQNGNVVRSAEVIFPGK